MASMYAVFAITDGTGPDLKFFSLRSEAASHATAKISGGADTADVYEIEGVEDARAAKAALEMGEGRFVEARGRPATQAEIRQWLASVL
jgi:hypothetical protein